MPASLSVGVELYRGVHFADRILEGPLPIFSLEEVIGQESPVLVNPFGKNGFHRHPDFLMEQFAQWSQKCLIGDLLRQGVVKDILDFRNPRLHADQGRLFEQCHLRFQRGLPHRAMCSSTRKRKTAPDDSRLLDHPFRFLGQAIQAGKQHSLEGVAAWMFFIRLVTFQPPFS